MALGYMIVVGFTTILSIVPNSTEDGNRKHPKYIGLRLYTF